jgi:hypothetical protein
MRVVARERWQAVAAREGKRDPARGKKAGKWQKDVILTKRTQPSIANKGLSILKRQKRTGF